jgi:ABC-type Fe3+/spermidine/putrescine transport system ATPase subunit
MGQTPLLTVDGVSAGYGQLAVLDGITLQLQQGEFLALLGRSGCGKTTLLRTIGGFIAPRRGRILIDGEDVTRRPPEKRPTAMVFQSYALWPHMTVHGNLAYGLKLRGFERRAIDQRIAEILALLRLEGLGERRVTALSGGQRQRVALGRALAVAPRLLLLDEPLSNLDARIRLDLRHEIRALLKRLGITAVHVTHDREEAMVMADRLALLHEGRIVQQGDPRALHDAPATSFVADFMGASNIVTLDVRREGADILLGGRDWCPALRLGRTERPAAAALGAQADVHFRSTAARLGGNGEAAPDALSLRGTILQSTYPGNAYRYAVKVADKTFLVDDPASYREGEQVVISLPLSAVHLFPHAESPAAA